MLWEVAFNEKLWYNMLIPVKINWVDQGAVVDTAAQVTVLSVDFAKNWG